MHLSLISHSLFSRKLGLTAFAALGAACLAPHPALAQTVTTHPGVTVIGAPASDVQNTDPQNDTTAYGWQEMQGLTLTSNVAVDISSPGTYDTGTLSPGTIAAGTKVDSFLLHTDPATATLENYTGSITFSNKILGLEVQTSSLDATDSTLGAPATKYPVGAPFRGLEFGSPTDSLILSNDGHTVNFDFNTSAYVDEVRIITDAPASTPEASTTIPFVVLALGIGGLVNAKKRRNMSA